MKEVWKDIPGYTYYKVSNIGRVKSLERRIKTDRGSRLIKEKILKNNVEGGGYCNVVLCEKSNQTTHTVHSLVAASFLNHKPNRHILVIHHINHNKKDNRVHNLRIVTQRENVSDRKTKKASKYTGVCWHKPSKKWMAQIYKNGKTNFLGRFNCEIKASEAYQRELELIKHQ